MDESWEQHRIEEKMILNTLIGDTLQSMQKLLRLNELIGPDVQLYMSLEPILKVNPD